MSQNDKRRTTEYPSIYLRNENGYWKISYPQTLKSDQMILQRNCTMFSSHRQSLIQTIWEYRLNK